MTLAAGSLCHRVELQNQVSTRDEDGILTTTWQTVDTVWASVEPLSAREFIQSGQGQAAVTARVTIRYRPDVDASWRALHRGKVYNIAGVLADRDSGLEYLTLPVSTGVNDGQ